MTAQARRSIYKPNCDSDCWSCQQPWVQLDSQLTSQKAWCTIPLPTCLQWAVHVLSCPTSWRRWTPALKVFWFFFLGKQKVVTKKRGATTQEILLKPSPGQESASVSWPTTHGNIEQRPRVCPRKWRGLLLALHGISSKYHQQWSLPKVQLEEETRGYDQIQLDWVWSWCLTWVPLLKLAH